MKEEKILTKFGCIVRINYKFYVCTKFAIGCKATIELKKDNKILFSGFAFTDKFKSKKKLKKELFEKYITTWTNTLLQTSIT